MAKKEKKSLASLVGNREIDPKEINEAVTKIHKPTAKVKEKVIRVTVDTPMSLYLKSKEFALMEGESLKGLYLKSITAYLEANKPK